MKFTLRQLQLFVALQRYPTLSAAADALHISESALSHAISKLERALGAQLCVRRKARGLQLTPTGHYFAGRAIAILDDVEELVSDLAALEGEVVGSITVGCFTSLASSLLPPLLHGMPQHHPGISTAVSVGSQEELLGQLRQDTLDFAFLYDQYLPSDLAMFEIYQTEAVAVLPESHSLAARDSLTLEELSVEPLVLLDATPSASNTLRMFADRGLAANIVASVPEIDLVRALVGRGTGYGILMARPASSETTLDGQRLVFKSFEPPASKTRVVAAWPLDISVSARARVALEFTRAQFLSLVQ